MAVIFPSFSCPMYMASLNWTFGTVDNKQALVWIRFTHTIYWTMSLSSEYNFTWFCTRYHVTITRTLPGQFLLHDGICMIKADLVLAMASAKWPPKCQSVQCIPSTKTRYKISYDRDINVTYSQRPCHWCILLPCWAPRGQHSWAYAVLVQTSLCPPTPAAPSHPEWPHGKSAC